MTMPIASAIDTLKGCTDIYNKIYSNEGKGFWLTLSPPYSNQDVNCLDEMYMKTIEKLLKCSTELLAVKEFSLNNPRLHYHICFSSSNSRARYIIINQIREEQVWQVCLLKGSPEKGLNYLLKEVDESTDILGASPLFDRQSLLKRKKLRLILQQNLKVLKKANTLDSGLPSWMLPEEDIESDSI